MGNLPICYVFECQFIAAWSIATPWFMGCLSWIQWRKWTACYNRESAISHCLQIPASLVIQHRYASSPIEIDKSTNNLLMDQKYISLSNYIYIKLWDAIAHSCTSFSGYWPKPPLKLVYGWVNTSNIKSDGVIIYTCNDYDYDLTPAAPFTSMI